MDKTFLEGLAALLNKSAEEVSNLFETDEESEETKLKDGVDVLSTVRTWIKSRTDDVYKAAERKTAQRFEGWVKSQGFDSDAQGTDLLAEYFATVKGNDSGDGDGDGDGGEWKRKYDALEAKHQNALTKLEEKEAEIKRVQQEGHRKVVSARLQNDVRSALGSKWAGEDDHFNILMNHFSPDRIKYDDNGKPVLLDEHGDPLTDDLQRPVKFEDHVKGLGKLVGGFHEVDPGKGGPPPPKGGKGGGETIRLKPDMTPRQFRELLSSTSDPEKRKAILEARTAQLEGDK